MTTYHFPNEATPPGSSAYYTVRFSPSGQHNLLALAFAWRLHLQQIKQKASDPGAARLKLDWWRHELYTLAEGHSQHPLAIALTPLVSVLGSTTLLIEMLDVTEDDIRGLQPDTLSDLVSRFNRLGGSLAEILFLVGQSVNKPLTLDKIPQLGTYAEAVFCVRDALYQPPGQSILFPKESTDSAWVNANPLLDECEAQVASIIEQVHRNNRSAVLSWVMQAHVLHKKLMKRGYPQHQRIELTPIRKLLAAWRLK